MFHVKHFSLFWKMKSQIWIIDNEWMKYSLVLKKIIMFINKYLVNKFKIDINSPMIKLVVNWNRRENKKSRTKS